MLITSDHSLGSPTSLQHVLFNRPRYVPKHKIRIVTAASLFDGHDAEINIIRNTGVEVSAVLTGQSKVIQRNVNAMTMCSCMTGVMPCLRDRP